MVRIITRSRIAHAAAALGVVCAISAALFILSKPPTTNEATGRATEEQGSEAVIGTWATGEADRPFLIFNDDQSLLGHDGCNGFSGRFTTSDDVQKIELHDLLGTLRGCPGVDTWLRKARSAVVGENTLTLYDESNNEIGQLHRD